MSNYYGYNLTQIQAYDIEKPLMILSKYTIYSYIRYKRSHNLKVGSYWYQIDISDGKYNDYVYGRC